MSSSCELIIYRVLDNQMSPTSKSDQFSLDNLRESPKGSERPDKISDFFQLAVLKLRWNTIPSF